MGRIWSDQRKYETWLQVELAAVDAMARARIVPEDAARDIRARAGFSIDRIQEIEQVTTAIASAVEQQGAATQEISRNAGMAAQGTKALASNISIVNAAIGETTRSAGAVLAVRWRGRLT